MSFKERLRTIVCCAVLELGVLMGVPMRPDEIHDLMRDMSAPKVAHTIPDEQDDGDPPPPP